MLNSMEQWAKELFIQHQKPIKKLSTLKKQLVASDDADKDNHIILEYLSKYADILNAHKVDRRCGRTVVHWLKDKSIGRATRIVGGIFNSYGYQNPEGHFLYSEEVIYLLEKNKIELFWNNLPVSIEQAYVMHLRNNSLEQYRAYKKLMQQGIKVIRNESSREPPKKKVKTDKSQIESNNSMFKDLFKTLQKDGPQLDISTKPFDDDFTIVLPSGGYFNYKLMNEKCLNPNLSFIEKDFPVIVSLPTDSFPCYKAISTETVDLT